MIASFQLVLETIGAVIAVGVLPLAALGARSWLKAEKRTTLVSVLERSNTALQAEANAYKEQMKLAQEARDKDADALKELASSRDLTPILSLLNKLLDEQSAARIASEDRHSKIAEALNANTVAMIALEKWTTRMETIAQRFERGLSVRATA